MRRKGRRGKEEEKEVEGRKDNRCEKSS